MSRRTGWPTTRGPEGLPPRPRFSPAIGEVAVLDTLPRLQRELADVKAKLQAEIEARQKAEATVVELRHRLACIDHQGEIARPGW